MGGGGAVFNRTPANVVDNPLIFPVPNKTCLPCMQRGRYSDLFEVRLDARIADKVALLLFLSLRLSP